MGVFIASKSHYWNRRHKAALRVQGRRSNNIKQKLNDDCVSDINKKSAD